VEGRREVHFDDTAELLLLHAEEQVVVGDAGVVHEHGDGPELLGDLGEHGGDGIGVAHVGADGDRPAPSLGDRVDHLLGSVRSGGVVHCHRTPVLGEPEGDGTTDPSGSAGDEGNPVHGHTPFPK
jgi:hypothetical protein